MGNQLQHYLDKEKILKDSSDLKKYFEETKKSDDDKLKTYFIEFSKQENDSKIVQGAYEFLKWIVENK
jgi:hypothetical protein